MTITDEELKTKAQELLDRHGARLTDLRLTAESVVRDADIINVLVRPSRDARTIEFVHVLAAVESELDDGDGETVVLVPVID